MSRPRIRLWLGRAGVLVGLDGREVRLCDPCVCVRPCVPCVSRLPPVPFYRYSTSSVSYFRTRCIQTRRANSTAALAAHGRRSPGRQRCDRLRCVRDGPQQTTLERGKDQRPPQRLHRGVEAITTAITSTAIYARTTITITASPGRYRADRPSLDQAQCPWRG